MSVMGRRLQLLLDQERYDRVAAEAQRSGRSVAAVIREAIDLRFESSHRERRAAAAANLVRLAALARARADDSSGPGEGSVALDEAYAAELERKLATR
ncbi:putative DNA-binding protein [Kineosphaera limosa]|nr:ribbon-helix-helix protein, CopG family [Kineosphaera limosa]NYE01742.1 putative DNA-binding protein [Kineosphaera limosa]